jgi:hypothetical protein
MTKKPFSCVDMKRRGAAAVREKLAAMSPQQELAFWKGEEAEMRRRQRRLRDQAAATHQNAPIKQARKTRIKAVGKSS